MCGWRCPFEEGYCRSENNKKECKNGGFFYRCADLNTKTHYAAALKKALQYDFDRMRTLGTRTKWDFYRNRKKEEDKGEACKGCREKDTEAFECRCQYLRANATKRKKDLVGRECIRYILLSAARFGLLSWKSGSCLENKGQGRTFYDGV